MVEATADVCPSTPPRDLAAAVAADLASSAKVDLKELGLVSGYLLGHHFFGIEDLHYGYWTPDLPVETQFLAQAQRQYSDFLLEHIPADAATILDVGCGTGSVAKRLLNRGHAVECISPSPFLTRYARETLGERVQIHECPFESFETAEQYDVVLFCESFQYVPFELALRKSLRLLRPGGRIIIADFFRTEATGKSPIGGGHRWRQFQEEIARLPLECVTNLDITEQTAPTLKLVNDAMMLAIRPIWEMTLRTFSSRYPLLAKLTLWLFRKRIAKVEEKQLRGTRSPANFARFKSYRLLVYRKAEADASPMHRSGDAARGAA